ncbi:nuclear transport factor 2 family protein [Nocardioides sp. JQ2195]|uniref:nuclear transport factor 2 family protein n=1 Tax=Nocardioides sp. JQ2195 TaxID=2592334 RepID=UPI00143EE507|nr:nuclear transport factor 2 family protein [Nocardioides sp. JQ2195]QIX26512.1 nuclear transport factor 2 family protein [Nocardioides sp. JQ2195]
MSATSGDRLERLLDDVRVLKDIEAIKRVKHAYFRCLDTANWEELRELLHPQLQSKMVGGHYHLEFDNRDDYLEMLANSFNSEFVGQHTGHHPEIDILSETEATGKWYLADIAMSLRRQSTTVGTAIYTDKYLKTNGAWQIIDTGYFRIYETVTATPEPPDLSVHYLAEHGRRLPVS